MTKALKRINRPLVLWPVVAVLAIVSLLLFAQITVMRYQMYLLVSSSANQSRADGTMALSYLAIIEGEHEDFAEEKVRLDRLRDLMIQRLSLSVTQLDGLHEYWGHKVGGYEIDDYRETEEFERIREILQGHREGASNQAP